MSILRKLLDFCIKANFIIALSSLALTKITYKTLNIPVNYHLLYFTFFGTFFSYNTIKYSFLKQQKKTSIKLKAIYILSFFSLLISGFLYLKLKTITQLTIALLFSIIAIYTIPIIINRNLRNIPHLKIYVVCFVWSVLTVIVPILESERTIELNFLITTIQRYILVFALMLFFEIHDYNNDPVSLKTIPQIMGIKKTKLLGYTLIVFFLIIQILFQKSYYKELTFCTLIAVNFYCTNQNKSVWFTKLWIEIQPVIWFLLYMV